MSEPKPLRVAIYARVSLGTSHGQSVEHQLLALREHAVQRGWVVYGEYADVCSGVKEKRPALDRLMKDAFLRKFSVLLVPALDRCSRSVSHMLSMLDTLSHYGVSLVSIREGWDMSGPQGRFMLTILSALAQMERSILADRVRVGMAMARLAHEKANPGKPWRCGRAPIAPALIEEVLQLRAQGCSLREIQKRLDRKVSKASAHRIIHEHAERLTELSQGVTRRRS